MMAVNEVSIAVIVNEDVLSPESLGAWLDQWDLQSAFVKAVKLSVVSEVLPVFKAFSEMIDSMSDTLVQDEPGVSLHFTYLKTLMVGWAEHLQGLVTQLSFETV